MVAAGQELAPDRERDSLRLVHLFLRQVSGVKCGVDEGGLGEPVALFVHDPRESQIYWLDESGELNPLAFHGPPARFCIGVDGGPSKQGLPFRPLGKFWFYGDFVGDHEGMWPAPDWKTVMWPTIFHSRVFVDENGKTWRQLLSYSDGVQVRERVQSPEELSPLLLLTMGEA